MATANTLKATMLRPALPLMPRIQPVLIATAPFSTTSCRAFGKNKKKFGKGKGHMEQHVKKPAPGERKAFRKRIVLGNNSALAVSGLKALEPGSLADAQNVGTVMELPQSVVEQLRTLGAFRTTQSWGLFRKPHFLVRKETVELVNKMDESVSKKEAAKIVLTGSRISGKSTAIIQAISHALQNNWVVINIPETNDLVIGNTEYSPISNTSPIQFAQPNYTLNLLQNILKANRAVLGKILVQQSSLLVGGLMRGATLVDLISNVREPEAAWAGFTALWSELTLAGRPPLLMTLDGLSHANKNTEYRDPAFNVVFAHDLTLLGRFFDGLSGAMAMPNGGAFIAADSSSNNPARHPSQSLALAQLEAGQAGREIPKPDPYLRGYDNRVYDVLKNSYVVRLEGISKDEARSLMEYWGASGIVRDELTTSFVAQKWALGGHGNIGEMERALLHGPRM